MNHVEIFKNPEFGSIRVVEIGGEPWLVGKGIKTRKRLSATMLTQRTKG